MRFHFGSQNCLAFLRRSIVRKLGKRCVLVVFLGFIQNRLPWQPPGQYGVGTRLMAASSGFA
jgi:hypothetical protein